ncbi:uncharacterized protein [Haliotis cracherodii]|uniref:uncharacterized protein n=1 Tax=Haliotis cracherodii TaxID=6455 RepID=UPI0039EADAA9
MLLYVEDKAFPHKTFVVVVKGEEKVARVRAQLLHILYNIGKETHQFRLRHKGQFLRDAHTLDQYDIVDNSIIKMIPMSKKPEASFDTISITSSTVNLEFSPGQPPNVKKALYSEIKHLDWRERILNDFKTLLFLHLLAVVLSVFTVHWYAVFWVGALLVLAAWYSPSYTRIGGFVGNYTYYRNIFCCCAGIVFLTFTAIALYLAAAQWITVIGHGCADWTFVDECSPQKVYTAVFFSVQALLLLVSGILAWVLLGNFKTEMGDRIEKNLIQERDIDQVILAAKDGKLNEKRQASSELAIMAAANDDNKFRIVAEGGLDILMSLSLQHDDSTQEHALEAIRELLTIPSIQDTFVNMGNVSKLTALLHSQCPRVMQAAASTIFTIVNESEENKSVIIADHGLEDLAHAARNGTIACQQSVASIFNELAINSDIRAQLTAGNIPAQALTELCRSNDSDTLRDALQALELMAIESAETICAQEDLLQLLLQLPFRTMDERNYLLVAKILIYYAENKETCQQLLDQDNVRDSLEQFARTRDPLLQRVVARIITCMTETQQLKCRAKEVKMNKVLEYIRDHTADRDLWDEADQALQMMNLDDLGNHSSVLDKSKLEVKDSFGSRTSMGSIKKRPASASSGAESDKGLA